MNLSKEVKKAMKNPKFADQIEQLRVHRTTSVDLQSDQIKLQKNKLPVYRYLDSILRTAQKAAEQRLLLERPDIVELIQSQQYVNTEMKKGNVKDAARVQQENLEKQQLLEYSGTR